MNEYAKERIIACDYKEFKEMLIANKKLASDSAFQEFVILHGNHSMIDYMFEMNNKKPFNVNMNSLSSRQEQKTIYHQQSYDLVRG